MSSKKLSMVSISGKSVTEEYTYFDDNGVLLSKGEETTTFKNQHDAIVYFNRKQAEVEEMSDGQMFQKLWRMPTDEYISRFCCKQPLLQSELDEENRKVDYQERYRDFKGEK